MPEISYRSTKNIFPPLANVGIVTFLIVKHPATAKNSDAIHEEL